MKDIQISNGTLSIPFTEKNNIYTIYLNEGAEYVEFTYELSDGCTIEEISGETYQKNKENKMVIKIADQAKIETQEYIFYLEKESDTPVFQTGYLTNHDDMQKEIPYLKPLVILICASIILGLFKIFVLNFGKEKRKKKKSPA